MRDASKTTGGHSVGEIVNNKMLIEYIGLNAHRHHIWKYQCLDCFSIHDQGTFSHIKRHKFCRNCRIGERNPKYTGTGQVYGTYLYSIKKGAELRGLVYDLTSDYLWDLWNEQKGLCFYSGKELVLSSKWKDGTQTASIDRIDNTVGYIKGNVAWVHKDINRMKSDFTPDYFIEMCKMVAREDK